MVSNLSARIAEREAKSTKPGKNRATFLALLGEVRNALSDGWSARAVWETLHAEGKVPFGYRTFLTYVERHAKAETDKLVVQPRTRKTKTLAKTDSQAARDNSTITDSGVQGFTFNPVPNEEELF